MALSAREALESPLEQGTGDSVAYQLDTTEWGTATAVSTVTVHRDDGGGTWTDVTSTVMPAGSNSISAGIITTKPLTLLAAGRRYRITFQFTVDSQSRSAICYVLGR